MEHSAQSPTAVVVWIDTKQVGCASSVNKCNSQPVFVC
ncbi:hypothetical protein HaLaN_06804, partial [Haematococcus lacustris]